MSNPGKLREVLDSLSEEPARSLPRHDRELMESVLRRLKIQEARRPRPYETRVKQETQSDLDVARHRLEELEAMKALHGQDQEELRRIQAERDALLEQQRELEERLARLEASSHGGPLSYVEQDEIVEFARVDLNDNILEFQYLGSDNDAGFAAPDAEAWEESPAQGVDWDQPAWDEDNAQVDWDDSEEPTRAAWQGGPQDPWAEPPAGAAGAEETARWEEPTPDDPFTDADDPAAAWQSDASEAFDEKTHDELADLERQLAELEREIADREKREKRQA
jgi:hypothetical protein